MSSKQESRAVWEVRSPLTGTAVALEQVPDPVFSQKIIGDGAAVIPTDGRIVSPVDGTLISVAETGHAYGFRTEDGLELLIHVGLETVSLKGECFKIHGKAGDKVKAGDLIAEVDLEYLKERQINPITPVLVCGGAEGRKLTAKEGPVKAGETVMVTLEAEAAAGAASGSQAAARAAGSSQAAAGAASSQAAAGTGAAAGAAKNGGASAGAQKAASDGQAAVADTGAASKEKKKLNINFDFLQKLGKVLMTVIAVMPAAGFMISLGKLVQMGGGDMSMILTIGSTMENIGWAVINNLHILFAVAIGGSWAKERAGGAFAAVISFILINQITGSIFGVTSDMLSDAAAVTHTLFGTEIPVDGYFTSVLGAPALNMGVFVGIISGFAGGVIYNKPKLFTEQYLN